MGEEPRRVSGRVRLLGEERSDSQEGSRRGPGPTPRRVKCDVNKREVSPRTPHHTPTRSFFLTLY
jgi:hypothetical protein